MTTNTNERPLPTVDMPPARRRLYDWFRFALVGASGILVNQAIIIVLTEVAGL